MPLIVELAILLAAFLFGTGVAELAGAENLGTAATFGTIAFAIAVLALIVRPAPKR